MYVYAQSGEYPVRWDTKITPLGQKLMYLHAGMNGITPLQEAGMWVEIIQYDCTV